MRNVGWIGAGLAFVVLASASLACAAPRASRLSEQAKLFEALPAMLDEPSGAAAATNSEPSKPALLRRLKAAQGRLAAIPVDDFPEEALTAHDVALYAIDQRLRDLSLVDGLAPAGPQRRYAEQIHRQTTTDLTAAEVEAIGLGEVERLNDELSDLAHRQGYADLASYRAALVADPTYRPTSADQIIQDFRHYLVLVGPRLKELVRDPPSTQMVVEAMKPGDFPNITHHVDGSADGREPSRILVATSDFTHRNLINDEVLAFHEGLPGHELQVSIAQRRTDILPFQRNLRYGAFTEGWAVYAEGLAEELGLFRTPAAEYGRVNTALTRALRLVADTRMHARGWSRQQVVAYLRQSGAEDEPTVQAEADRIVAWPAQGLAYTLGLMKLTELRRRAEAALGPAFDRRDFHAVVLDAGSIPLPVLEGRVDRWIIHMRTCAGRDALRQPEGPLPKVLRGAAAADAAFN